MVVFQDQDSSTKLGCLSYSVFHRDTKSDVVCCLMLVLNFLVKECSGGCTIILVHAGLCARRECTTLHSARGGEPQSSVLPTFSQLLDVLLHRTHWTMLDKWNSTLLVTVLRCIFCYLSIQFPLVNQCFVKNIFCEIKAFKVLLFTVAKEFAIYLFMVGSMCRLLATVNSTKKLQCNWFTFSTLLWINARQENKELTTVMAFETSLWI